MFEGNANAAMNFYISLFPDSKIVSNTLYQENESGTAGTIKQATFSLNGQTFMCIDSFVKHAFTFTPSMSLFVNCETEDEVLRLFNALSESGNILMPLAAYPFAKKYAWLTDKFGISWQLSFNQ